MGRARDGNYGYCPMCGREYDGVEVGDVCNCGRPLEIVERWRRPTLEQAQEFIEMSGGTPQPEPG